MKTSPYNDIRTVSSIAPAVYDATEEGATVDLSQYKNYHRTASVSINVGVVTDGTHTFSVEESANGSDWTAVPAARLIGSLAAATSAADERVLEQGVIVNERYLRVVSTVTGSPSTGGLYSAVVLLGDARRTPAARS